METVRSQGARQHQTLHQQHVGRAEVLQLQLTPEQQEQSLVAAVHLKRAVPQLAQAEPLDTFQWGQERQEPTELLELLISDITADY